MVSLMNNEGLKFYLNPNDTFSQYPNYLYDNYAYPSNLNQMDYHWNLFYPQNSNAIQRKRKKKFKEQLANEKNSKENIVCVEPSREEVIEWLKYSKVCIYFEQVEVLDARRKISDILTRKWMVSGSIYQDVQEVV